MIGSLVAAPVIPATIVVDEVGCTLIDAIESANNDTVMGGCAPGDPGVDTIELMSDVSLTEVNNEIFGRTGLPVVVTDIIIEGGGRRIELGDSSFRIFAVALGAGDTTLTLRNTTVSGGFLGSGVGAGIYVADGASLSLEGSTVERSTAYSDSGGGIGTGSGTTITLRDSTIRSNLAGNSGGGVFLGTESSLVVDRSVFDGNELDDGVFVYYPDVGSGGGIDAAAGSSVAIVDSSLLSNGAFEYLDAGSGMGGGIAFAGKSLTMANSLVRDNIAKGGGGVHISDGLVTLANTTFSNNRTDNGLYKGYVFYALGGSGVAVAGGRLTMIDSLVVANEEDKGLGGAGIRAYGASRVTLTNTTVAGNRSEGEEGPSRGAGLLAEDDADVTVINSTVSNNYAEGNGGGVHVGENARVTLIHSTLVGNDANGRGPNFRSNASPSQARVISSVIVGGSCSGGISNGDNNFTDSPGCPGAPVVSGVDIDPALAKNGGPTPTHALLAGSVAIDGGIDCPLDTDQRGVAREDGVCDSGSFEFGTSLPLSLSAAGSCPGVLSVELSGATPDGSIRLYRSAFEGMFTLPAGGLCEGVVIDLDDPETVSTNLADDQGNRAFERRVTDTPCGLFLQAVDATTCTVSDVIQLP